MGAKVSQQMIDAMRLIRAGATAYAAAKAVGIAESTISRSRLYRAYLAEKQQTRPDAPRSPDTKTA